MAVKTNPNIEEYYAKIKVGNILKQSDSCSYTILEVRGRTEVRVNRISDIKTMTTVRVAGFHDISDSSYNKIFTPQEFRDLVGIKTINKEDFRYEIDILMQDIKNVCR